MKIDLSNKNLKKIDYVLLKELLKSIDWSSNSGADSENDEPEKCILTLIANNNSLSKLENLEQFVNLKNLSLANNRLVEIRLVGKLVNLEYLNLVNNSLTSLDCFKNLKNLTWLNISGNQIKNLAGLKFNTNLRYLDASENSIASIGDLSALIELTTLNLNGNEITSLRNASTYLPKSLKNFFINYNAIDDLNEISYLEHLNNLESLSIDNNPCATTENLLNYRPFVLNWCTNLTTIDGIPVTQKEILKAEWLYSQGKGRHFRPGQNLQLIEYLIKNCPCYSNESIDEEVRLSKVLEKKEIYEQKLNEHERKEPTHAAKSTVSSLSSPVKSRNSANDTKSNAELNDTRTTTTKSKSNDVNTSSTESLNNTATKMENKYIDYDNRPIKPLDQSLLKKQLMEYTELSTEELDKIKQNRVNLRSRSKTTENLTIKTSAGPSKAISRAPNRQLSFNSSNQSNQSFKQSNPTINRVSKTRLRSKTQDELNTNKKSSLVSIYQGKLNTPGKNPLKKFTPNTPPGSAKTKLKYNSEYYSPKANKTPSQLSSNNSAKKVLSPKKSNPLSSAKKLATPVKSTPSKLVQVESSSSDNVPENANANETPNSDDTTTKVFSTLEVSSSSTKVPLIEQLQHLEIHERIQKQRNEMRLMREKNFREIKNQLKALDEQKELQQFENISAKTIVPPKNLTYKDKCAIKIQAAWRGYFVRKSKFLKPKIQLLKFKKLQFEVKGLRSNLKQLETEHLQLISINMEMNAKFKETIVKILTSAKNVPSSTHKATSRSEDEFDVFKYKIEPLKFSNNSSSSDHHHNFEMDKFHFRDEHPNNNNSFEKENQELKQKCKLLEEKCRELESKLNRHSKENFLRAGVETPNNNNTTTGNNSRLSDSTNTKSRHEQQQQTLNQTQPKLEIFPPLRVRLQKLNEKSVALKWNHNPKNNLIELTGYNIYINEDLLATMRGTDKIASIDGIKEEGEYRIYIKSLCGQVESEPSNTVITRVKKKQHESPLKLKPKQTKPSATSSSDDDDVDDDDDDDNSSDEPRQVHKSKDSREIEKIIEKLNKFNDRDDEAASRLFKNIGDDRKGVNSKFVKLFETSEESISGSENNKKLKVPFQRNDDSKEIESSKSFQVNVNATKKPAADDESSKHRRSSSFKSPTTEFATAKISTSEPSLIKTQSSTSGSGGRTSLVRQSISFSDNSNQEDN